VYLSVLVVEALVLTTNDTRVPKKAGLLLSRRSETLIRGNPSIVVLDFGAQYSQLIAPAGSANKRFFPSSALQRRLEEIRSYSPVESFCRAARRRYTTKTRRWPTRVSSISASPCSASATDCIHGLRARRQSAPRRERYGTTKVESSIRARDAEIEDTLVANGASLSYTDDGPPDRMIPTGE